jgi:trk system potassium uptake protein TrkH
VVIGGRAISASVVYQSASIAVASVVVVLSGSILLMASQTSAFDELLFEAFSAFGTVGLSLGATAQLDTFGKVVVVLLMLVGRVGPLAITLLLARDLPSRVRYPEARLMVG